MADDSNFDVVVIGGGPGGYICAIRCAQLGMKVACVEDRATLGGTCLNVGCIPSKAMLQSSYLYEETKDHLGDHGIKVSGVSLDLAKMLARKQEVVGGVTKGVEFLFRKNKIAWLKGRGRIAAPGQVEVAGTTYGAKHIIIATGSDVTPLAGVEVDEKQIVSSTGALELGRVPKSLVVIGAGVIGLELGSVWHRLGAEVTVVEFLDRILPPVDFEVAKATQRILEKQGLVFRLATKVTGAKAAKSGVTLSVEPVAGGAAEEIKCDIALVAVGRKPHTDGLGAAEAGVQLDRRGFVQVNAHFQTAVPGIYAIGDVIGGAMLAHKAEEEGVALAELIAGQAGHVNYEAIPSVVYTHPEVASVGANEEQLKAAGVAYKVGKFPFSANARARANNDTDGFVKIIADATTDRILGAHIVGPQAGDLIQELAVGMEFSAAAEDIARTSHAHPSLSESIKEAALGVDGRMLNM